MSGKTIKWFIFFLFAAIVAAAYLGYLDIPVAFLKQEALALSIANHHITLYEITKFLLVLVATFWVAGLIVDIIVHRIEKIHDVRSTTRTLWVKFSQIIIYFLAFLMAMDALGIDLTALTVFSGALGIGLGFGLQKITANFISGLILLFEKSIEADDLIELNDGTFGFVRRTGARFTLIETFDGKEIMIPNEDFITSRVTNWTYSSKQGRVEVKLGISYKSDTRLAMKLMLDAARENPEYSTSPAPACHLREFGDSSVNLLLYFWVDDVSAGRYRQQSDVMLAIQDKFKAHGIEIPFPQRDLHIISSGPNIGAEIEQNPVKPNNTVKE